MLNVTLKLTMQSVFFAIQKVLRSNCFTVKIFYSQNVLLSTCLTVKRFYINSKLFTFSQFFLHEINSFKTLNYIFKHQNTPRSCISHSMQYIKSSLFFHQKGPKMQRIARSSSCQKFNPQIAVISYLWGLWKLGWKPFYKGGFASMEKLDISFLVLGFKLF